MSIKNSSYTIGNRTRETNCTTSYQTHKH
jgi:hypothetical protein